MRLHIFQHVAFEGVGSIAAWAQKHGHSLTYTRFYQPNWGLPSPAQYDALIVMGGPMGVYDEEDHAWLKTEKQAIRQAIDSGRKVLGICLGAQLAASVLGSAVEPNEEREIGWFPVAQVQAHPLLAGIPDELTVFHWHGDTYSLPYGAEHLLASAACAQQAFLWRGQVLGLQCHLEMQAEDVERLLLHGAVDFAVAGDFVQNADAIRAGIARAVALEPVMHLLLTRFLAAA